MTTLWGDTENGHGEFDYGGGATYVGQWQDGRRHGKGIWTFADGTAWEGRWRVAEPHGPGTWRFPGGLEVEGAGPVQGERQLTTAPAKWRRAATDAAGGGGAGGSEIHGQGGTTSGDTVDGFGKKQYTCGSVYEVRLWFSRLRCFLFQS